MSNAVEILERALETLTQCADDRSPPPISTLSDIYNAIAFFKGPEQTWDGGLWESDGSRFDPVASNVPPSGVYEMRLIWVAGSMNDVMRQESEG